MPCGIGARCVGFIRDLGSSALLRSMLRRCALEKHLQTLHRPCRVDEDYLSRIENCGLIERDSRQALRMQKLQLQPTSSRETGAGMPEERAV